MTKETQMEASPAQNVEMSPPDHEEIARLAYSYWEARGRDGGSPEEDWFRAESDLTTRLIPTTWNNRFLAGQTLRATMDHNAGGRFDWNLADELWLQEAEEFAGE
jgi:hypothetical protein